ncbi:MAG TPA: hypothetical protein VL737_00190 [Candidatus Pristimantibacillus sp.]|jgi:hypothetical protein|nr:hypothetical protein [Candidatus Pristimantibacillus sp.]
MATIIGQQEFLGAGVAVPLAQPPEAAAAFNPNVPASEIDDLRFVRLAMEAHAAKLGSPFRNWRVAFADHSTAQQLEAVIGEWTDPRGDAEQVLATVLAECIDSREAQRELIVHQAGDSTLPPEAFKPLDPWDAKIQETQELLADRRARPAPPRPRISPFWLGPVRKAVMIEAKTAEDPVTRAAARDLAERRIPLSTPYIARRVRGARIAAAVFLNTFLAMH